MRRQILRPDDRKPRHLLRTARCKSLRTRWDLHKAQPTPEGGYLILEAVIAFGIIAVGIFAMLSVQRMQSQTGRSLTRHAIALEAASSVLERVRASGPLDDAAAKPIDAALPSLKSLLDAKCRVWISDLQPNTPGLKRVKVTVTWLDQSGRRCAVTLETLVAKGSAHGS